MDEKAFFDYIDKKFEAVAGLLESVLSNQEEILDFNRIRTVVKKTLSDFSKAPKAKSTYYKEMPEMIGQWTIGKKGCNRCGGAITWDNYKSVKDDGTIQMYPDHVDKDGVLISCPEYKPKE